MTVLGNYLDLQTGSTGAFLPAQGMTLAGGKIVPNPNGQIGTSFFDSEPAYDNFHEIEYFGATQFQSQVSEHWIIRNNFRYLRLGLPQSSASTAPASCRRRRSACCPPPSSPLASSCGGTARSGRPFMGARQGRRRSGPGNP